MSKYCLFFLGAIALVSCSDSEQATSQEQAAPKTIGTPLADGYSCDSLHIYYYADTVDVAHRASFKVLGGGYAKDDFSAYYQGKEVQGAQGATFRWVAGDTAVDVMDTYVKGKQIKTEKK